MPGKGPVQYVDYCLYQIGGCVGDLELFVDCREECELPLESHGGIAAQEVFVAFDGVPTARALGWVDFIPPM